MKAYNFNIDNELNFLEKAEVNMAGKGMDYWISHLNLKPHPEGGYYTESFRSKDFIPSKCTEGKFDGKRSYLTSIYFLLSDGNFSAFHRLKQDEIWSYHTGSTIFVHIINDDGSYEKHKVGLNIEDGETPQFVIKAGQWFSYHVEEENGFTLVGCVVVPGFEFADFELGKRQDLIAKYPQHKDIITKYTRN
ncbi:unnamed protein product [Dimorphilus gyrociliatus]|uniref:DUF985 domain-containing protein n=1 Tax=Dimorphilus gyrociliatus TaxID=2664684 RepID=A0A7I8WEA4_9ANNE|nr:unnamed protein product [Dimorphilus gyrociliatus]